MSYIEFKEYANTGKTSIYNVVSTKGNTLLGTVRWFAPWRQYCFQPNQATIFDPKCLSEIGGFIKKLMEERKNASTKE